VRAEVSAPDLLPDIIVTASGYRSDALKTPNSVTVIGADNIRGSGAATAGDLLRGQPGVAVNSDGAWGMNPVIRGLRREQLILMVDGVRMNAAQPYGALASLADLGQLERVEVVRHPVSVLYGSGASGGVINLITKPLAFSDKPRFSGSLSGAASSDDNGMRSALTTAFSGRRDAMTLGFSGQVRDDYHSPGGPAPHTGYREYSLNAGYKRRVGAGASLQIQLQRHNDSDVWHPGSRKYANAQVGYATVHSPRQDRTLLDLSYEQELAGGWSPQLRAELYYQDVFRTMDSYSERLLKDYVRNRVSFRTAGGRAQCRVSPHEAHSVLAGLDVWRMSADPERWMDQPPTTNQAVRNDPFDRAELVSAGVFAQDELSWRRWTLQVGARYDQVRADAAQVGTGATAQTTGLDSTDHAVSWSVGGIFHHSDLINPYVNGAMGFRAGDMRERFERSPRGDGYVYIGNPSISPEKTLALEAGLKGRGGGLRYAAAVYGSRMLDYISGRVTGQTDASTGLPIKATENIPRVEIWGAEASLERDLPGHHTVFLLGSFQLGSNKDLSEPLYQVPPAESSLGVRRRPSRGWTYDARLRAVAGQERVATAFTRGGESPTAGFITADLGVGYRLEQAWPLRGSEVRLGVGNLFNTTYHEHLTEGVSGQELPAPGRRFTLVWKTAF
jgi:hemoglobin/transferrin/lactoferrin receptor protein